MKTKQLSMRKPKGGFTLVELLVVIAIIGMLAAFVVPQMTGRQEKAKYNLEISQIAAINQALEMYNLDCQSYPTTQQGLKALSEKPAGQPDCENWGPDPYMKKPVDADSWDHPYVYQNPGVKNSKGYDLISLGKDGKEGGEGLDKDINGWE